MSRDHGDALLDQLLHELLGNDRPRDMTARVLTRAALFDRARRHWWIGAGAAVAALLVLGVTLFVVWPREYPEPEETGIATVDPGEQIERGTELQTGAQKGTLDLGGYVHVDVDPHTQFMIKGKRLQEAVALDAGRIEAAVTKKKGTFDVMVGRVDVHVTGTHFSVQVEVDDAANPPVKRVMVNVSEGAVQVTDTTGAVSAVGGEGNPSDLKLEIPLPRPPATTTHAPETQVATASAPAPVATAPATVPATVPANVLPRSSPTPATPPEPPATRPATSRPTTAPATAPATAASAPAANVRALPPLVSNAKMADGSSQGIVIERNGNYSLINGSLVFDLPKPDARPNGIHYLPGDSVTVTWSKGVVTKVEPAKPPAGIMNVGPPNAR